MLRRMCKSCMKKDSNIFQRKILTGALIDIQDNGFIVSKTYTCKQCGRKWIIKRYSCANHH